MTNSNQVPNKLINEKSPYLLQHAYNPVQWYPWGNEAFGKAKNEDKPIFLSIGYSTCHWCHVMEEESFKDEEIANLLNNEFVSIKVDREERSDIDSVYMQVCQSMTGQGGWPLTIIMTPDQKPFYSATYIPKKGFKGMPGLTEVLPEITLMWKTSKSKLLDAGEQITNHVQQEVSESVLGNLNKDLLHKAYKMFSRTFDKQYGGFGQAPKFPASHNLLFLMRYAKEENEPNALNMALKTLDGMYKGGMFDHIGGGFSRYSTDKRWLVPHFEKMLYDNALLAIAYLEAYLHTKKDIYAFVARQTLDYVLRELTDPSGGFYCGQDADSEGVEGKYYVFSASEILDVLGEQEGKHFCEWFNITTQGNFEGKNILNLLYNNRYEEVNPSIGKACEKLYDYRIKRTELHKDDKCLTSWNSLMIVALSKAFIILEDEKYLLSAKMSERFIADKLTSEGHLQVRYRDGNSAGEGMLDDYAFYIWSLLELYDVTFDAKYITKAVRFAKIMCQQFFDYDLGGFYHYGSDSQQLIARPKDVYDGAMPSGNSVAALVLEKLFRITGDFKWKDISEKQFNYLKGNINDYPMGYSFSLLAAASILYPFGELVATMPTSADIKELFKLKMKNPNLVILTKTHENQNELLEVAPFLKDYDLTDNPQFYLCWNSTCLKPVSLISELNSDLIILNP